MVLASASRNDIVTQYTKRQFDHYVLCFNLAVYYYKMDDCKNAKRFVKIALENGFKDDRFNSETNKINEVIQENCP